ncbi:MAG TPA: potassium-transporting ATPase subunit KdpA [Candidatus Acidoferrum sp.]|nr:potassium-transporting ATPase subunit KdpA [Candidatus Acidoferrum sp.]
MTGNGWFQILLYFGVILLITKPMGVYLYRVFERKSTWLDPVLRPIERLIYRVCGIEEKKEMKWTEYGVTMLVFSAASLLLLYLIERLQVWLPLNPQELANVAPDLAWNTAVSFTTNTNWQAYTPETTMSYLTQMAGLAYHNFASAAVGIALAVAVIRGVARKESSTIGNFWVDATRAFLWALLPFSLVGALFLVSQGVVQNLHPYTNSTLLESQVVETKNADGSVKRDTVTTQVIAQGPVASQEAIKMYGTNGGGFFNANSAHPFENPTPLSNFFQMLLIFAIPSGLTYTLGRMTGSPRHGWAVWSAMAVLFLAGVLVAYSSEARGNPLLAGVNTRASDMQPGGNMEGKEVRFGIANSALFTTVTTDASCGAVNNMHDSLTPIAGMVPLINIMLGEVIFGGVGAGLYGVLVFVILSVFIAGLMVGRTPEYLGKKIESFDVKMAVLAILVTSLTILIFSAIAVVAKFGVSSITNPGAHGLSQILYAYTSSVGNNGSAFAGLNENTLWYNTSLAVAMLLGRFFMVIPILAIAGNLAAKKQVPESLGTFPVTGPLFTVLLISVVLIVGALTFFPALSLGPILEHLLMNAGKAF